MLAKRESIVNISKGRACFGNARVARLMILYLRFEETAVKAGASSLYII